MSKAERIEILIHELSKGEFLSGEYLGQLMGISRAAVWKYVKALGEMGIEFESVPGKGYRVPGGIKLLDEKRISAYLSAHATGVLKDIFCFYEIGSTNQFLLELAETGKAQYNSVCVAESQTSGRGRRGKAWVSPFARNVYCSILWRFEKPLFELEGLSLVVALSILDVLEKNGYSGIKLKWPNDLLFKNKKLAGILLEVRGDLTDYCDVVIGFGINVSMPQKLGEEIEQEWVDLESILEASIDRNILIADILSTLSRDMENFEREGFSGFYEKWNEKDAYSSKEVLIMAGKNSFHGVSKGVNYQGALILEINGEEKSFHGGEVSLRGYGGTLD